MLGKLELNPNNKDCGYAIDPELLTQATEKLAEFIMLTDEKAMLAKMRLTNPDAVLRMHRLTSKLICGEPQDKCGSCSTESLRMKGIRKKWNFCRNCGRPFGTKLTA